MSLKERWENRTPLIKGKRQGLKTPPGHQSPNVEDRRFEKPRPGKEVRRNIRQEKREDRQEDRELRKREIAEAKEQGRTPSAIREERELARQSQGGSIPIVAIVLGVGGVGVLAWLLLRK